MIVVIMNKIVVEVYYTEWKYLKQCHVSLWLHTR